MPGFKDGRVDGLVSELSEVESTLASLKNELAKVKSANEAVSKKVQSKQDSLASALMAAMEKRFMDAQKTKEVSQNLITVYFGFNRAEISPADQALLASIAAELVQDPVRGISVQAFSDEVGDESSNEKIRRGRERAVVGYLTKRGVRKAQIEILPWNGSYTGIDHYDRRVEVKRKY
jgi:outer membrane protein OmpA-like peptidoglycan-associated protein